MPPGTMTTTTPDKKLGHIRALRAARFTLIPLCSPTVAHEHMTDGGMKPCKTPGKVPARRDWRNTRPDTHTEADLQKGNYGIALQATDLVLDIDPRNFSPAGDKPVARLAAALGVSLASFTDKTGGGGYHVFFTKPADIAVRNALKEYPGLEFKSVGQQVVGPGCLHASGREYEVAAGDPAHRAPAPQALLSLIQRSSVPFSEVSAGTGKYMNDAATQGRFADYLQYQAPTSGSYLVACKGRDLGLPPGTTLDLMVEVWNPRRATARSDEELRIRVEHAYKYARGNVGSSHPAAVFDAIPPGDQQASPTQELNIDISWDTTPNGEMKRTFNNLLNFMRSAKHGLYKIFAFNEFTGRVEFVNPAPWHRGRMPTFKAVGDNDLKLLKGHLAARHGFESSVQGIEEAVTNVAYHERFHPVREYLTGLKWDGTPRLDTWLKIYLGAIDDGHPRYLAAVSRKVLCAAVMRVMRPGIKYDHVLVLEGVQDLGKSTVVELLGGDWASDAPIDPHNRDTVDTLQGRWIVEMAEMAVLRNVDEEALKAFITRRTDRVRLVYQRTTGEYPRQSIFIATKNPQGDGTYLKDPTGNRRWWPVRCEPPADKRGLAQIDFTGLKAVRDQLFAEAMARMSNKDTAEALFMETPDLKHEAGQVAAARHADHEWMEVVASWIARLDEKPDTRREFLTTREVYIEAVGGTDVKLDKRAAMAVGFCLRTMGWIPTQRWNGTRPVRGYVRVPETAETLPLSDETDADDLLAGL